MFEIILFILCLFVIMYNNPSLAIGLIALGWIGMEFSEINREFKKNKVEIEQVLYKIKDLESKITKIELSLNKDIELTSVSYVPKMIKVGNYIVTNEIILKTSELIGSKVLLKNVKNNKILTGNIVSETGTEVVVNIENKKYNIPVRKTHNEGGVLFNKMVSNLYIEILKNRIEQEKARLQHLKNLNLYAYN